LDHAYDQAVNSRLLVRQQKMHGSRRCYGELEELIVADFWQIADAGDQELWRLAHSSQRGTLVCAVLSCDAILGLNSANYSTLFTYSVVFRVTILAQMKKRDIKNEKKRLHA